MLLLESASNSALVPSIVHGYDSSLCDSKDAKDYFLGCGTQQVEENTQKYILKCMIHI